MQTLHLLSVLAWTWIGYLSLSAFLQLKDQGFSKKEVTAIIILLLACLNISRGAISLVVDIPRLFTGQVLLEYFYIGSTVFQVLLCDIVLKYIKPKQQ